MMGCLTIAQIDPRFRKLRLQERKLNYSSDLSMPIKRFNKRYWFLLIYKDNTHLLNQLRATIEEIQESL